MPVTVLKRLSMTPYCQEGGSRSTALREKNNPDEGMVQTLSVCMLQQSFQRKVTLQTPTGRQVPDCTAGQSGPVQADMKIFFLFCAFFLPVENVI